MKIKEKYARWFYKSLATLELRFLLKNTGSKEEGLVFMNKLDKFVSSLSLNSSHRTKLRYFVFKLNYYFLIFKNSN